MASALDSVIKAAGAVLNRPGAPRRAGQAPGGLLDQLGSLLGSRRPAPQTRSVRPASEDPYGDPADQRTAGFGKVKPASQDPYGDPADQVRRR